MFTGFRNTANDHPLKYKWGGGRNKRRLAFTLSEVLITLVVIGVVAAITIPNLVNGYQKEQTVTQLKKAYSDFCGALKLSETVNGRYQDWDYSLSQYQFFTTYLSPFISIHKDKKSDIQQNEGIVYLQSSGQPETGLYALKDNANAISLTSGVQIFAGRTPVDSSCKTYVIDINGYKKPNKFGRDLFHIAVHQEKGILPHAWDDEQDPATIHKTRDQLLKGSSNHKYNCSKKARGMWCMAVIMADGWKIKNDYPW